MSDSYEHMSDIRDAVGRLKDLACAFHRTGNSTMSKELIAEARLIDRALSEIRDEFCESSQRMFQMAQESSANMLKTAFAVSELKDREKENE